MLGFGFIFSAEMNAIEAIAANISGKNVFAQFLLVDQYNRNVECVFRVCANRIMKLMKKKTTKRNMYSNA